MGLSCCFFFVFFLSIFVSASHAMRHGNVTDADFRTIKRTAVVVIKQNLFKVQLKRKKIRKRLFGLVCAKTFFGLASIKEKLPRLMDELKHIHIVGFNCYSQHSRKPIYVWSLQQIQLFLSISIRLNAHKCTHLKHSHIGYFGHLFSACVQA